MVTYALDLAIITPACILAGFLVLRRPPLGYLMTFLLLGIIVLLAAAIGAQTVSQLVVGVRLTPGEILGPVIGFIILSRSPSGWPSLCCVTLLTKCHLPAPGFLSASNRAEKYHYVTCRMPDGTFDGGDTNQRSVRFSGL